VIRINIVLLLALLASALVLVKTSYESRRAFAELERALAEERQLEADFRRLDAERQAQATHGRVERVARDRLKMRTATPAVTAYVQDPLPAGAEGGTR
jgi:cell division protein FtsL